MNNVKNKRSEYMPTEAPYPTNPVLLVDDEDYVVRSLEMGLRFSGITNTLCCSDGRIVMEMVAQVQPELLLLDLMMPHVRGEELLRELTTSYPEMPVLVITGVNEIDSAVQCMQAGAFDYIVKPVEKNRLIPSVRRALEICNLRRENRKLTRCMLEETLKYPQAFDNFITRDYRIHKVFQYCEAVAEGNSPVLVTGESGVGKDFVPGILHTLSRRAGKLVTVNVAGLDDNTFSDTLFGHLKGAFTGAAANRNGLVETAAGGTLFLDEIGDLSAASQVKLLRLLEQREYFALGSDIPKTTDARIILATHKNLRTEADQGRFRQDLFFRLQTHQIVIPPLRERPADILPLLDHFLRQAATEFNKPCPRYHPELLSLLNTYHFPGNVRELKAMVINAVSSHTARMLSSEQFRQHIEANTTGPAKVTAAPLQQADNWATPLAELPSLKQAQETLVTEALRRANANLTVAASLLGISRPALAKRLKRAQETED